MKKEDLLPHELRLFEGIGTILLGKWHSASNLTPEDFSICHSEIFTLALADASPEGLAQYLHDITIEKLGLPSSSDYTHVAHAIYRLGQECLP
jgi:hypothetical protein